MVARLDDDKEPVFAIESVYSTGFQSSLHSHERGQITLVRTGLMSMMTGDRSFVVPAGHAIWIPAGMQHVSHGYGNICMLSAYVDTNPWPDLPKSCAVFQGSDLFEPLLKRVIVHQLRHQTGPVHDAQLLLLNEEIAQCRRLPSDIPMPQDPRLRRVCNAVIREPTISNSKEELARLGNMSCRTMTRLFKKELDMTFLEWVQQALIISAVGRLARGEPVANVASDLGYGSPSAFTAMFRRRIGRIPSDFVLRRH